MMKNLTVKPITADNFSKFGSLISTEGARPAGGDANYDWYAKLGTVEVEGTVSVNIMHLRQRPFTLTKIEYHLRSQEVVLPLGKPFILTVAPGGKLQEDAIEAFYVPADRGVCMAAGTRHFMPFPLYEDTDCVIIFRDGSGVDDLTFEDIQDPYTLVF
jgi:ureidoglycolate hydrolase